MMTRAPRRRSRIFQPASPRRTAESMTNPMLMPNMKEKIGTKRVATRKYRALAAGGITGWTRTGP